MKNDKEPRLWVLGTSLKDESFNIETSDKVLLFSQSALNNLDSSSVTIESFYSRKNFNNEIDSFNNGLKDIILVLRSNS